MTLFFPDLNVWLALSVGSHSHSAQAWQWIGALPLEIRLVFCRYTHIGLLRLLTNESAMGQQTLTLRKAWGVYDRWLEDPRVEFYPEPRGIEALFRETTAPMAAKPATSGLETVTCWHTRSRSKRPWLRSTGGYKRSLTGTDIEQ